MKYHFRVKKMIEDWLEGYQWGLKDFKKLLEYAEICNPKVFKYAGNNTIECITEDSKSYMISFSYGDGINESNKISICHWNSEEDEYMTKKYSLYPKWCTYLQPLILEVVRSRRGGRELSTWLLDYSDVRKLYFKDYTLAITLRSNVKEEIKRINYSSQLWEYLYSLEKDMNVDEVLEHIISIIDCNKENLIKDGTSIFLSKNFDGQNEILAGLSYKKGKINKYAKKVENETFRVYESGDWEYLNYATSLKKLKYSAETKKYSLETKENFFDDFNPGDWDYIKKEIQELFKNVLNIGNN